MELRGKYYKFRDHSSDRSILRVVDGYSTIDKSDYFLLSCYDLGIDGGNRDYICKKIKQYNLKLVVDCTTEILPETILKWPTDNMVVYYNLSNSLDVENELKSRGVELVKLPFFLKYLDYYTPTYGKKIKKKKKFLFLVGKTKVERVCLIGLLSYYGLLDDAYYSYFGNTLDTNFDFGREEDYHHSNSPILQKEIAHEGLTKLDTPITLDVRTLNHVVSHAREYKADYYKAVDFVLVAESEIRNNILFITEKISKCIQLDKKFIVMGGMGLLKYTKEQAKIHLDKDISHLTDWCDTSYDTIENHWERIDKIVDIIKEEVNTYK